MLFSDGDEKLKAEELQIAIKYMNSLQDSYENIDTDENIDTEEDRDAGNVK